jgi:hypothetical protein
VVGVLKQPCAATVAGEQQRSRRPLVAGAQVELEQLVQILVGGGGIANMELHRLADADALRDRQWRRCRGRARWNGPLDYGGCRLSGGKQVFLTALRIGIF